MGLVFGLDCDFFLRLVIINQSGMEWMRVHSTHVFLCFVLVVEVYSSPLRTPLRVYYHMTTQYPIVM